MSLPPKKPAPPANPKRRRFVQGLAAGGVLAANPGWLQAALQDSTLLGTAPVLSGTEIDLVVAQTPVNFTGRPRMAVTINGSIPGPTLRLREGDDVTIRVTNQLTKTTSIHWHGLLVPYQMDGVPGISYAGIAPGETFVYRFKLQQSGTYWYHSHSGMQEMLGMYGVLIIEPRAGERIQADREHVVTLSDWPDESPMHAFNKLRIQSNIYNFNQPTFFDFTRDISTMGFKAAFEKRQMWNEMRMAPTDLADLSANTLTYLLNGVTPAGNWTGLFKRGEKVRLRFVNAASNTFYDVRIPGLKMTVVQADGQDVEPVSIDEFRFGPAQTYDVLVEPEADAYTLFAQAMERTGYARGTLATANNLVAPVPAPDAVEWLTMADMMGEMSHDGMNHDSMNHAEMDHSTTNDSAKQPAEMDHGAHGGMAMDHSNHGEPNPLAKPSQTVNHARTEYGPSVDMRVNTPRTNLDDPGIGLRNNGRRVLTLADLKSVDGVITDWRPPVRELELHLTGNMERYSWSFDGLEFGKSTPVSLRYGERVRIILQNDTMMTHPMHLHGMWSELETAEGELRVRLHTIPLQPAQRISFLTTPEEFGRWAWHCHLLFHMDAGMFREVVVS
jgi:CopA family copper-resistance protein